MQPMTRRDWNRRICHLIDKLNDEATLELIPVVRYFLDNFLNELLRILNGRGIEYTVEAWSGTQPILNPVMQMGNRIEDVGVTTSRIA